MKNKTHPIKYLHPRNQSSQIQHTVTLVIDETELEIPVSKITYEYSYVWNKLTDISKIYRNPSQIKLEINSDNIVKYVFSNHNYCVEKYGIFSHNQAFINFGFIVDTLQPNIYDHYLILITYKNITAYLLTVEETD